MKKFLILVTFLGLVTSCGCWEAPKKKVKPFIIVNKVPNSTNCWNNPEKKGRYCRYVYQDANGVRDYFCEEINAYEIGDTIH